MRFTKLSRDPASFPVAGDIEVRRPPALPATSPAPMLTRLLPVLTVVAMAGMMAFYFRSASPGSRNPMFLLFPVMMAVSVLSTMVMGSRGNRRNADVDADRREYLRFLTAMTDCAERSAIEQYEREHRDHPAPDSLWHIVGTELMWQRCSGEPDFGVVRIGLGSVALLDRLVSPSADTDEVCDPVTFGARDRLLQDRTEIAAAPVTIALDRYRRITITGAGSAALVRALVCQLAVWHGPDQMRVLTVAAGGEWDWLKWLPHHHRGGRIGDVVLRCDRAAAAGQSLDAMTGCHVVVIDSVGSAVPERPGVTVIELGGTPTGPSLTVAEGTMSGHGIAAVPVDAEPDGLTVVQAVNCARRMAKYELGTTCAASGENWLSLAGFDGPDAVRPELAWRGRDQTNFLRTPVGATESGEPVYVDLKEAAQHGMGPHGLCIGVTGSGKSEFLRTLTLGLISSHSPAELNLILVDFKGGATFLGFDTLHHVAAVITNLAQEAHLVSRMRDALAGELTRRQEVLRAAGNLANIGEYHRAQRAGLVGDPLPALFIVVDEFSELLSQYPDFADLFVAIGRLGRSLGIHLLLASQRLEEGRLRGLDSHLSYRICLKTFSAAESRAVLGVPDAHALPGVPGSGYLRTADGELIRFRAAFVSAPVPDVEEIRPMLFTGEACGTGAAGAAGPTVLRAVVDRLSGFGPRAHRVWLPPLDSSPVLAELLRDRGGDNGPKLCVPIGLVDNPFGQRRDALVLDLRDAGGHVAVVGGPRSGKSTALQSILLALAATHSAGRLNIYGVDLGHGAIAALRGLPHIGAVAEGSDPELLRRIISRLLWLVRSRQSRTVDDDEFGEVILAIDGMPALRRDFPDLEDAVTTIAAQGLSVGVHLLLTSSRWADLRPVLKDQLGSRIELRLGDPAESEMDRRRAQLLSGRPPGRGITRDGQEFVIALPQVDVIRAGPQAPRIEVLPELVALESLTAGATEDFVIGLAADGPRGFTLALTDEPLAIVLGDNGSGKTTVLRALCRSIMAAPGDALVLTIDYRRTSLGVVEPPHLAGYAMSASTADAELASLLRELEARIPGPGVTQQQLRHRTWWTGPELYLIVDDYDLVAGVTGNPLLPLLDFLPHARDIGLHLVIARRSGGAARGMFDPILSRMNDLGASGLLMSAAVEEGVLMGGVRSAPLPPGRAVFIRRGQPDRMVQIGWSEPP